MDDLIQDTGLERRNLYDNIKASSKENLVTRTSDVTGQPADKLTPTGRAWLANNEHLSVTTQAGSGDITPAVADASTSLASAFPGQAATVIEPPIPDDAPVAVRSDESALSKSVTEFCDWIGNRCMVRTPRNLREAKAVIDAIELAGLEMAKKILKLESLTASKDEEITELQRRGHRYEHDAAFVVMPDYPDIKIHQSLITARAEAEELALDGVDLVHVVAIVDTAEISIKWKRAA